MSSPEHKKKISMAVIHRFAILYPAEGKLER